MYDILKPPHAASGTGRLSVISAGSWENRSHTAHCPSPRCSSRGLWFHNGGEISLSGFLDLSEDQRKRVWDYMNALPLYREVEAGGRKFILVHGGLGNFSPDKELHDYKRDELVWCRPEPDTAYFPDKLVVVGHTPTQLMYDKAGRLTAKAEFYRTDSFIDIDCGCVFRGGKLGCLCLDTLEEIYV